MQSHAPVLLTEVLEALDIRAGGTYFDGTFGRGGHSQAILECLNDDGLLIAVDRDDTAIEYARHHFKDEPRLRVVKSDFGAISTVIEQHAPMGVVDGVFLDLGVSSPQLDTAQRGFSFRAQGPLDMRMDVTQKMSAASWLASAELRDIRTVIKTFGEERFAHRIASAIVRQRQIKPLETTLELAELVASVVPKKEKRIHPATRTFQAIRIFINGELDQLKQALAQSLSVLSPGGRLAVISFHSLEDRIVKRFMRDQSREDVMYSGLPNVPEEARAKLRLVGKQIRATDDEVRGNPRSRSAVLRVAERLS